VLALPEDTRETFIRKGNYVLLSTPTRVKSTRRRTVKGKVLSADKKKALALDVKADVMTDKQIATKHGVSTKTVQRARRKMRDSRPKSVLDIKRSLELTQMSSMMIFYLQVLERQTRKLEGSPGELDKVARDVCEVVRENLVVTLNIHNSLAFTEVPMGPDDYTETDVTMLEALLEMIPPERLEEFNAKISELTARKEETGTGDTVQQEGRPEAGAVSEESGPVRQG
jgi:hypothetical protein